MKSWKWSTGEPYYKSARPEKKEQINTDPSYEYDSQQNAINQSLADDSFFNQDSHLNQESLLNQDSDLINITNSMFSRNQNSSGTRREDIDTKMADRELLAQRGVNPFLQTSYVNDIVTRDMFLKPINTTQGRAKETNKEEEQ
jgi:hypothetical protein